MRFPLLAWIPIGIGLSFLAQAATIVEGSVLDDASSSPIAGAHVEIKFFQSPIIIWTLGEMTTGSDGAYQWSGDCYPTLGGECFVHATAAGYAEAYVPFDGTLPLNQIDVVLQRISTVSGHVHRASDGAAVAGATVRVGDESAVSGAAGEYTVSGLVSGAYSACASADPQLHFIPQCFDHLDRGALGGTPAYTPIEVVGGENLVDINFELTAGGAVSGTLIDGHRNRPLEPGLGTASVYDLNGVYYDEYPFSIDTDGRYVFGGMPDGEYYVSVTVSSGFIDWHQLYPGIVCEITCSSPTQGQLIAISNGGSVDGIDFVFHPDRIISGTIRDFDTGEPLGSVPVKVYLSLSPILSTTTDAVTGSYHVYVGGSSISYHVAAEPEAPFINAGYPDQPCTGDGDCWFAGEELRLGHGDVRDDIDFRLHRGAAVSGRVINSANGQPLAATLNGYDADFNYVWSTSTREDGSYISPAWLPGTFYVSASPTWSLCAFYANRPCPAVGEDPGSVMPTPLAIGADEIRQDIDFEFLIDVIFQAGFDE